MAVEVRIASTELGTLYAKPGAFVDSTGEVEQSVAFWGALGSGVQVRLPGRLDGHAGSLKRPDQTYRITLSCDSNGSRLAARGS
jgi:hypothetical protein